MKRHFDPDILRLMDRYQEIVASSKNQKRKTLWKDPHNWNRDMWRGIPVERTIQSPVPFTIALDNSLWSHVLDYSLKDYYSDPEFFLKQQLRKAIFSFENFDDDTVYTNEFYIWFGVITELSILGVPIEWFSNKEGWIKNRIIKDEADLAALSHPDFRTSGLMPKIHQYYEVLSEYAGERFSVMFPEWVRGPFCLAMHMRGVSEILVDCMLEEEFVRKLLRFVTDSKKRWDKERTAFLGQKLTSCNLYNDEIDCPSISPDIYKNIIFPYEKELADEYGSVKYWHSCGNTTIFQNQINKLTNLKLYHCGPWTDFGNAVKTMDRSVGIDLCVNPQKDVVEASEEQMRNQLKGIRETGRDAAYGVRADAFMINGTYNESLIKKIQSWSALARETFA
ncbi:MAG: uroporphyrinogen decarboxylase family protein [Treponemataceae bacterium]